MDSLQGRLLVATPQLVDPNFNRSVVLMVQHDHNGALGLVLNRPSETRIDQAWGQVSHEPCERNEVLYVGGPCPGVLMVIHADAEASEMEVLPGLHFTAGAKPIERLVADPSIAAKFFVGYAGWGAGQLEREIEEGSWLSAPGSAERVFNGGADLWAAVYREVGKNSLLANIDPKRIPPDPSVN